VVDVFFAIFSWMAPVKCRNGPRNAWLQDFRLLQKFYLQVCRMRAISAPVIMISRSLVSVFVAVLLLAPVLAAVEPEDAAFVETEPESEISPVAEAELESIRSRMELLTELLASVVDPESAAAHASQIKALYEELRAFNTDFVSEEDEEFVAAEFEEVFLQLEDELRRLDDADCYGCVVLAELIGVADAAAETTQTQPVRETPVEQVEVPAAEAGSESTLR
jgi:hypothetical protein